MFYPVDSLKRGGRFYLCWIADSWPLQFEKLTHRNQRLWSQDIREICEHLRELMMSESGRPSHRFSLRLSSQLMRGLTRIYQKKVELFIRDVWRINNDVVQRNRPHEPSGRPGGHRRRTVTGAVDRPRLVIEEMPEEVNVERIMENATNQVARVEDITLRELTLPEVRLVDDGFGELNLQEPVEVMLAQEVSVMQHSALELPADVSDAHDKSRLAPHDAAQMEPISEHDMSLFRKSAGEAPTLGDFEKELSEISEIPPPELPAPEPQNQAIEPQVELPRAGPSEGRVQRSEAEIVLDPLEDLAGEPRRKRRRLDKLIVDKNTQLDSDYYRVRIANDDVELRCATAKEDVIQLRTPAVTLLSRPARSGAKPVSRFSSKLGDIFIDRLAGLIRKSTAESDLEEQRVRRATTVPVQETIQEMQVETVVQEPANRTLQEPIQEMQVETIVQEPASKTVQDPDLQEKVLQDITNVHVTAAPAQKDIDISMLPTQKILTVSQENRENLEKSIDKRSLSQRQRVTRSSARAADKENIPVEINIQGTENMEVMPPQSTQEHDLNIMLQQAGLADVVQEPVTPRPPDVEPRTSEAQRAREGRSSETPLGSLDRTKVSLGDTDKTTDTQRFINEEWGTRGTMFKIFRCALVGVPNITVELLVRRGPVLEGCRRRIAARCFTSILKLSSQRFIKIIKDADTNEIKHIELGPRIPLPGRN